MSEYYPVYLNLTGKRCVIFGGGTIAQGKIPALLEAEAHISVISPDATPGIQEYVQQGEIAWLPRKYRPGDLSGAFIAVAATNLHEVNREIFQEAEERGVLLNAVDDTPLCTFIAPSLVKRGPVTLAISTGGVSPALARKLRETLNLSPDLEWADLAPVLAQARQEVKQRQLVIDPDRWQTVMTSELLQLAQSGGEAEALQKLLSNLMADLPSSPPVAGTLGDGTSGEGTSEVAL